MELVHDRRVVYAEVVFLLFCFWVAGWWGLVIHAASVSGTVGLLYFAANYEAKKPYVGG